MIDLLGTRVDTQAAPDVYDLDHIVCCRVGDGGKTYCGLDATGLLWREEVAHPCVVCDEALTIPGCFVDGTECPEDD